MKKYVSKILALFFVALSFSFAASAQIYVNIRPEHAVIGVRPVAPSPRHVWVDDEWVWRNGNYEHVDGYWAVPGPGYYAWVPGHWRSRRHGNGWAWVPGHWR